MPPSKKEAIAALVVEMLFEYRNNVHSILTDNGGEFADFKHIERFLKTNVFFGDPYSSRQKGAIEYANKLYRQYIPGWTLRILAMMISNKYKTKLIEDQEKNLTSYLHSKPSINKL